MIIGDHESSLETTVLYENVSWERYEAILDAIGDYRLRHCYIDGRFELRRLLADVAWRDYQRLLVATGDMSLPHTYLHGWLELMSPLKVHDWSSRLLMRLIDHMCTALGIPIQAIGSTTISSKRGDAGFQPDEAFYIQNERRVRGRKIFEPDIDPPPDLILEIDVTSYSVDRMETFAAAGVPELWRLTGAKLEFFRLRSGQLKPTPTSRAFPFLRPGDIEPYLAQAESESDTKVVLRFVAHAKRRFKAHTTRKTTSRRKDS